MMTWPASGPERPLLQSVSFDLDGTFADTSTDLAVALNAVRRELGLSALAVAGVARNVGRGARWLISNCIAGLSAAESEALVARFLSHYEHHCCETTAAYDGLDHLCERLREVGVRVSIATNKPRLYTELIVAGLSWEGCFDSIHCGDDGPGKPDPAMLYACIEAAKSSPATHLHIGDTPTDAAAAQAAGCAFAACFWGMDGGAALIEMGIAGFAAPAELIAALGV
jgi:phosphoglycolate phosphatase